MILNVKFNNVYDVSAYSTDSLRIIFGKNAYLYFIAEETKGGVEEGASVIGEIPT